jgi:hypothetical protein
MRREELPLASHRGRGVVVGRLRLSEAVGAEPRLRAGQGRDSEQFVQIAGRHLDDVYVTTGLRRMLVRLGHHDVHRIPDQEVIRVLATAIRRGRLILTEEARVWTSERMVGDSRGVSGEVSARALQAIAKTPSGKKLLDSLESCGRTVTIKPTTNGNSLTTASKEAMLRKNGKPGAGCSSVVRFDPDRYTIGTEPWATRPPAIGLAHELIHADHAARGTMEIALAKNDSRRDRRIAPSSTRRPERSSARWASIRSTANHIPRIRFESSGNRVSPTAIGTSLRQ